MSDLKPKAQEDKDVVSGTGPTQEPLHSHTSSLKNNAAGLSSDEHENPLNGAQPNPFVYGGVPAVPHAGNSLPSGALVNGPGSHPTLEVHCVLNKGSIFAGNVLDTARQPEKDTRPQVLPPPSELQSDAWKNTAGLVLKTLAAQRGASAPPPGSEENEFKLAYSTLSGNSSDQTHVNRPLINKAIKTRPPRNSNAELSASSSGDSDGTGVIRWDSTQELKRSLRNGQAVSRRLDKKTRVFPYLMSQRKRKHNVHTMELASQEEVPLQSSLYYTSKHFCAGNVGIAVDDYISLGSQSDLKYSVEAFKDQSNSTSLDAQQLINSVAAKSFNEENDPEDEANVSTKPERLKTELPEHGPLVFPCTICNVNFQNEGHLHRHMMYHLDMHNQVNYKNVSQPFICRECGRLFCDSNSLMRHIIIHQERLEKLMEEIRSLQKFEHENGNIRLPCPQCEIGCNCPKTFVQQAKSHERAKHHCEECNYITLTEQAYETHLHAVHLNPRKPQYWNQSSDVEEVEFAELKCKMCSFTSRDKRILEMHCKHEHKLCYAKCKRTVLNKMSEPVLGHLKDTDPCKGSRYKQSAFYERDDLVSWSSKHLDIYMKNSVTKNSLQFKCQGGCAENTPPSLWKIDKHGILSLLPEQKIDVAAGPAYAEKYHQNCDHNAKQTSCPSNVDDIPTPGAAKVNHIYKGDSVNMSSPELATDQSLSMRQMSTPSDIVKVSHKVLPIFSQRLRKDAIPEDHSNHTSEAIIWDGCENEKKQYGQNCFVQKESCSTEEKTTHVGHLCEDGDDEDDDCSDITQLIIKEEHIETPLCEDAPPMPKSEPLDLLATSGVEHNKSCPYCPAVFESGVGLSNHVRGHLHRVGLSYNARHMVSPEQVALQDCQPRIRKRVSSAVRRLKKADKPESQGAHICPLCWGWFDTKTGLSNHVRGHLKRIGKTITSTSKSPVCILNELLQDQEEYQNILQVLNRKRFPSRPYVSKKFISGNGLFLMQTDRNPVKIQCGIKHPYIPKQEAEEFSERKTLQVEAQRDTDSSSSTLVELLKTTQNGTDLKERDATRKHFNMTKEVMDKTHLTNLKCCQHGESDSDKICLHCNATFPTAVSLSSHLRPYARRKRFDIFERTSYDFKQKKPRPRPGLKKKVSLPLNAVEEIYRLTCRFCNLVFQGPLSVQEDWIRHLQRHLMHTSVPRSGTGMVEILGLHRDRHDSSYEYPSLDSKPSSLELPVAS